VLGQKTINPKRNQLSLGLRISCVSIQPCDEREPVISKIDFKQFVFMPADFYDCFGVFKWTTAKCLWSK